MALPWEPHQDLTLRVGEHPLVQTPWSYIASSSLENVVSHLSSPRGNAGEDVSKVTSLDHFFFIPYWEQNLPSQPCSDPKSEYQSFAFKDFACHGMKTLVCGPFNF